MFCHLYYSVRVLRSLEQNTQNLLDPTLKTGLRFSWCFDDVILMTKHVNIIRLYTYNLDYSNSYKSLTSNIEQ